MWNDKKKAITFSLDDGVLQDIRCVEILNKYGLKGTFNLNSGTLGTQDSYEENGRRICRDKVRASAVKTVYAGHEVAVHTLTHPNLTRLDDETVIRQVDLDRRLLEELCGYPVVGMAYPCGGVNNDERVAKIIGENTPIRYSRTITSTYSFELQKDHLLQFHSTLHFLDARLQETVDRFLALETDEPQLLYIWGHTYELDKDDFLWEDFEKLCAKISGKEDIFYGTNKEVLL
jgi:peptidoglycan/xylan/chitin deacetylase (PgdA/CDA1 family)